MPLLQLLYLRLTLCKEYGDCILAAPLVIGNGMLLKLELESFNVLSFPARVDQGSTIVKRWFHTPQNPRPVHHGLAT